MPLYIPYWPAQYVTPLLAILQQAGGARKERILAKAELTDERVMSGDALSFSEFDRLLVATAEELGRDDLGFAFGQELNIEDHDTLGVLLRQCTTGEQFLLTVSRFHGLMTRGFSFDYRRSKTFGELTIRPTAALSQKALYVFEELFAVAFHRDTSTLLDGAPGVEVFLSMPKPRHYMRYQVLRPTRFYFEANPMPEVRCRLPIDLLHKPLHQASPIVGAASAKPVVPMETHTSDYKNWVSMILREAQGVQPRLTELASLLNISASTLKGYLRVEGTSVRELGNLVRIERAKSMLHNGREPISDIAYRLGYASPTSFFIAFRKLCGIGPREFRKNGTSPDKGF